MATHQTLDVPAGGVIGNVLTTELNALASASATILGTAFDNGANKLIYGAFQMSATWAVAPTIGGTLDLFMIPATDGSTYNDGSATVLPQNFAIGSFNIRAVNTLQILTLWGIQLLPTPFKMIAFNNTDQALGASGHTIKLLAYAYQSQ